MPKKIRLRIWGFIGLLVIIAGIAMLIQAANRPQPIALTSQEVAQGIALVKRMYLLEGDITCFPETSVDVLAEVMVDSTDYRPSPFDVTKIKQVYGVKGLQHAGLLTSKRAYYQSRRSPPVVAPPPGVRPTAAPSYYCPSDREEKVEGAIHFVSAAIGKDNQIILRYHYGGGLQEVVLRQTKNKWMITNLKLVKWYGI